MSKKPNRLINEKSPYLLAHAYNPVDWYPWSVEAFEKAKKEDKPIFLSIGYSSCHWCHVMEKESFVDEEIAEILNRYFVPIKVDREERPDIDAVYMEVCMLFNGNGGWPLTVLMTPDKKPFFAGTYFPKESRPTRVGLKDLLLSVAKYWQENRKDLIERSQKVIEYLKNDLSKSVEFIDKSLIDKCYFDFKSRFDEVYGGFSNKPKFPSPQNLMFLLKYFWLKEETLALHMVEKTLKKMRYGGMFDHVGFGFHRYSTDRQWILPHFEKMLYDQAMLIIAYSQAYQITQDRFYMDVVDEVVGYLKRDMLSPEGGFYSSEDADSEGEEGKFYTFEYGELKEIIGEDFELFSMIYNVKPEGNYLEEATGKLTGRNILYIETDLETVAQKIGVDLDYLKEKIKDWREKLFIYRSNRVKPFKDEKILTDWNSLALVAFSKAGKATGNEDYIKTAKNLFNFIKKNLYKDGKLFHLYKDKYIKIEGMLDDYAFLIWGCIELYEATTEIDVLEFGLDLQKKADELFYDKAVGGYFLSNQDDDLIVKPKPIFDGAYPSGNSVMINNLLRLYHITSDNSFYEKASKTVHFFSEDISKLPSYHSMSVAGLMLYFYPISEVVFSGKCKENIFNLNRRFLPQKVLLYKDELNDEKLKLLAPYTENIPVSEKCSIYICKNFSCNLPTEDLNYALKLLEEKNWR